MVKPTERNLTTNEMKGYKATYNMVCRDFEYEVGQIYTLTDPLLMCQWGFHFCERQQDVLTYYRYRKGFILLEVEALGNVITLGRKCVTDRLRIVRVVPKEELEFILGDTITYKNSDGTDTLMKYDAIRDLTTLVPIKAPKINRFNIQ